MLAVMPPSGPNQSESLSDPASSFATQPRRELATGEILFRRGDQRTCAYRILAGAVCVFRTTPEGVREVIEVARAGDLIGLGLLERHVFAAEAVAPSSVVAISLDAVEQLAASDLSLAERRNDLVDREVAALRDAFVAEGRRDPTRRVAAFLIALAQSALREGRDPTLVADEFTSGVVADHLGLDLDSLQAALVALNERDLIALDPVSSEPAAGPRRLRLTDLDRLRAFASG